MNKLRLIHVDPSEIKIRKKIYLKWHALTISMAMKMTNKYTFSFIVLGNHLNGDHFRKAR